jgi:hypothetical protein
VHEQWLRLEKAETDYWTLNHYEILPDRIIIYVWPREGSSFEFKFKPRFAEKALTAPSKVYDYYNPEVEKVLAPVSFSINE